MKQQFQKLNYDNWRLMVKLEIVALLSVYVEVSIVKKYEDVVDEKFCKTILQHLY